MRRKPVKTNAHTTKPIRQNPVSAVRRRVHPPLNLEVLQRNLVKNLRPITHIDPKFLEGRTDNFAERVKAAIASYRHLKHLPGDFNHAILVVFDAKLVKIGDKRKVVTGFRKSVLLQSKRNPKRIHVLNVIEKSNGEINLKPVDEKSKFYILSSATAFYNAAIRKK